MLLRARWRPCLQNQEADDLTNDEFRHFDPKKRILVRLEDLEFKVMSELFSVGDEYLARLDETRASEKKKKREKKKMRKGRELGQREESQKRVSFKIDKDEVDGDEKKKQWNGMKFNVPSEHMISVFVLLSNFCITGVSKDLYNCLNSSCEKLEKLSCFSFSSEVKFKKLFGNSNHSGSSFSAE